MIRKVGFIALALILSISVQAQENEINFVKDATWKKVLKMAKKQNKPIFVDAYTSWCGPCKMMSRDVFTNKEVAEFFNETFINVKIDMEKGEGTELKDQWGVNAFPTLLYFDSEGSIIHRLVGAHQPESFLLYSRMAINYDMNMVGLQKKYEAGERNPEFIYNYLVTLRLSNNQQTEMKVSEEFFETLTNDDLLKAENWNLVRDFLKDPTTEKFQYIVNNKSQLSEVIGKQEVEESIFRTIKKQIDQWSYWHGDKPFDTEKEANLISFLQESNYERAYQLLPVLLANKYKRIEDKEQYLNTVDFIVKFNLAESPSSILGYAKSIISAYENEVAIAKAITWLNIAEAKESRIEYKSNILTAKSEAYKKIGNKTEAEVARLAAQEADKEAEKAGTKIHSVPMVKMQRMERQKKEN